MHEFKIPEDVPEALREIQRLLMAGMHDVDGMRKEVTDMAVHAKLTDINSAMADAHLLCTWIRGQKK